MIRNIFKIAFRNLLRHKLYAAVIILSLAIGLSFANILIAFMVREASTDAFFTQKNRIYRLLSDDPFGERNNISYILENTSEYIAQHFPEIEKLSRVYDLKSEGVELKNHTNLYSEIMVLGVDSSFLQIFDFSFAQGYPLQALQPNGVVLTQKTANKIFGKESAVGETVTIIRDTVQKLMQVTGVIDELPENSHLQFDALVHYTSFINESGGAINYVLLNSQADPQQLADKISQDVEVPGLIGPGKSDFFLQPLPEVYFDTDNTRSYIRARNGLFITLGYVVTVLILFISSFNFINLFMVSLLERKKEVGIKKVLGASTASIRLAAFIEVCIFTGIALLISLLITVAVLPGFNQSFASSLTFTYLGNIKVIVGFGILIILLSTAIAFILSLYVSRIDPISLISQRSQPKIKFNILLFTLQFVISTALIICSAIIIKQTEYIKNKPLGFNRHVIELQAPSEALAAKLPVLKQKLLQESKIEHVSLTSGNPITGNSVIRYELENEDFYTPYFLSGDEDLLSTLGLELIEGQNLTAGVHDGKLVNKKLVEYFNLQDPIGAIIPGTGNEKIIGVVNDFNSVSLKKEIPLYIIGYNPGGSRILVDYTNKNIQELLPRIEKSWKEVFPENRLVYHLLDEELLARHEEDFFFYRIIVTFSIASILITCFGLFALVWGNSRKKTKEIGIRKTLGASVISIIYLLIRDFSKWVMVAFMVAVPIAYYAMHQWLQSFAFKTEVSWWIFALSGVFSLFVALLTVSFQTVKASLANPVDALRYE